MNKQGSLFDGRKYRSDKPQLFTVAAPTADQTVYHSIPAYYVYLGSGKYSRTTPDDYTTDIKRFGLFTGNKAIKDISQHDVRQWINNLKQTMPPKTVNRKVSALGNYFRWLKSEHVIEENPAATIKAEKVYAPIPDLLTDGEVDRLSKAASDNPRTYLLLLLFLDTGMKMSEVVNLKIGDFDFSNKYQPEVWVKHSGRASYRDRRLKLSAQIHDVFKDYIDLFKVTDQLFPLTTRTLALALSEAARTANITKEVSASTLRDISVVRYIRNGGKEDKAFERIGLSPTSYDDARKKYGKLTRVAL